MTRYIASPFPSPLYIGSSAAARVWSIKHIRVSILENLSISDLASNLRLSRGIFHDVARVLYRSMDYVNYEQVQKACTNVRRLRYYTNLIRHINLGDSLEVYLNQSLFNAFPSLRSADRDDEHLILQDQSPSSSPDDPLSFTRTKMILWERYHDSLDIACGYYFRDLVGHKIPMDEWEVDRRISYTFIYEDEEYTSLSANGDSTFVLNSFYKYWNEGTGLFESIIDELDLSCVLTSRRLLREMTDIYQKQKDGKDISMPRKLRLAIFEEDDNLTCLTEVFSGILEELEMYYYFTGPVDGQPPLTTTTIHSFFSKSLNWSIGNKLKSLTVLLKVEELSPDTRGSLDDLNLDHSDKRHLLNLEKFTITLDFHQLPTSQKSLEGVLDRNPDMSQIAKGMVAMGGTGCVYTLDATGSENDKEVGKGLTKALKVEIMRLWVDSPAEIGWEHVKTK
ncbi:hypothetical protein I204_00829 [Kwoniella mangroviensis CBS 8886]|nr:hypothetical protein I204_00829 [Kwoniella mangroviensis CBS 8886]